MTFEDYIRKKEVRKGSPDTQMSQSLIKTAQEDLEFLNSLTITEKSSRKIMVNYYDTLRAILEAIAIKEGYKVYSHEAFTYYLKEKQESMRKLAKKPMNTEFKYE